MTSVVSVISLMVAPAGMITANAIILGSMYERLAVCINRLRQFNHQVEEIIEKKMHCHDKKLILLHNRHVRYIRSQSKAVLDTAAKIQHATLLFESSVLCNLLTGFVATLTLIASSTFVPISLVFSGLSMILLILGVVTSLGDAFYILDPVEHEFNESVELSLQYLTNKAD
jgi:hypothetical protein